MKATHASLEGVRVLTTDPEKRIGLYAIRYLGRAGASVSCIGAAAGRTVPIGFLSKYLHAKVTAPSHDVLACLRQHLSERSREYDIINPIDISKMLCVLDTDQQLGLGCNYLLPKRESLVVADNKELLTKHALTLGLKCPKTFYRIPPDDIDDLARALTYPSIIKFRGDNRETHWNPAERYSIVDSPQALRSEYRRMHEIEQYPVIQEYIRGQGYGYFALFDGRRNLKAQFCHRRVREYPITGGPSSCCEGIYDRELIDIGRRLVDSLEWTGLAMVECKFDEARREFFIIEVNPRYWGSLPLAVLSGVNFPVLHALSALGVDYEPVLDYRLGVKVRFLMSDIKSILQHLALNRNGPAGTLRLFLDLFNPLVKDGLISFDDMWPLVGTVLG